jgi:hypothetical protein
VTGMQPRLRTPFRVLEGLGRTRVATSLRQGCEGLVLQSSTWSWRIARPLARSANCPRRALRTGCCVGEHTSIPRPAWRSGTYGGQQLGMRYVSPDCPAMESGELPETLGKRAGPNIALVDCSLWLAACSL